MFRYTPRVCQQWARMKWIHHNQNAISSESCQQLQSFWGYLWFSKYETGSPQLLLLFIFVFCKNIKVKRRCTQQQKSFTIFSNTFKNIFLLQDFWILNYFAPRLILRLCLLIVCSAKSELESHQYFIFVWGSACVQKPSPHRRASITSMYKVTSTTNFNTLRTVQSKSERHVCTSA